MADTSARIEQFRKMAEADPTNEIGHFSLGRAYMDAGQFEPAIASFKRVLELNPNLSKVYQLLATALLQKGDEAQAIQQLQTGVKIADERGEMLPRNEMMRMLGDLGGEIPQVKAAPVSAQPVGEGEVLCARCGRVAARQKSPPFSGEKGKRIFDNICADCWREWIGMGTKVINELRLPLHDPQAQKIYDQHMMEFLNLK